VPASSSEIWLALIVGTTAIVVLGSILFGSILYSQRRFIYSQREKVRILEEGERQLKESYDKIRQLAAHIQSVREEERTSIAREIHDELGQLLTVLKMDLALFQKKVEQFSFQNTYKEAIQDIQSMSDVIDTTIKTVRTIATELRPEILDELGLRDAIEWEIQRFQNRLGIKCTFNTNVEDLDLDKDSSTALFRILQETLTNVARHSGAAAVDVTFEQKNHKLMLQVADNGKGITDQKSSQERSFGILGMRERVLLIGGEFTINGENGKGTTVTVKVPLISSSTVTPHTDSNIQWDLNRQISE
jgi:signal transduction histidine kinase